MDSVAEFCLVLFIVTTLLSETWGAKDKELYCGVCHVIADELQWEISQVDPRKTLEVESFRVDPRGNQNTKKIQYARSETHLIEQLDNMCEKMNSYAESTDPETGKKSYIRTSSRSGEAVTLSNVAISGDIAQKLKHVCESIIEDYDDDIIATFKKERKDPKTYMCRTTTGLCINDDDEYTDDEEEDDYFNTENESTDTDHDEL
ncbi:Protein canopy 2 [Desmophyllum pertusum]|uniref:Protein canopy 2 n=1 Tax=Desmophyllum pertusum TaxID=174260 RepID=A0A9W9Z5K1_9CNID|nr:Protein canopy 2 [Desmophyllum pertusum]